MAFTTKVRANGAGVYQKISEKHNDGHFSNGRYINGGLLFDLRGEILGGQLSVNKGQNPWNQYFEVRIWQVEYHTHLLTREVDAHSSLSEELIVNLERVAWNAGYHDITVR